MIQLTITVNDTGQVNVSGSLENQVVAYGLLAVGQDCLRAHYAQAVQAVKPATIEDVRTLSLHRQ